MLALLEFATSSPWRFICTIFLIEAILCPITGAISALGGGRRKDKRGDGDGGKHESE